LNLEKYIKADTKQNGYYQKIANLKNRYFYLKAIKNERKKREKKREKRERERTKERKKERET
jgi:hypothetical protein